MAVKIDNPIETAVGAVVLAGAVAFGVYAAQSAGSGAAEGFKTVQAKFLSASGIASGSDVRVAGVKVGRVESLRLDPITYKALVVMSVDQEIEITKDAFAKIDTEGLLGGSYIAIEPGAAETLIADGGVITKTQGSVSLLELIAKFAGSSGGE